MGEESQEEPEATADSAEVSGVKTEGGRVSQTLLEQVQYILLFNKIIFGDDHE